MPGLEADTRSAAGEHRRTSAAIFSRSEPRTQRTGIAPTVFVLQNSRQYPCMAGIQPDQPSRLFSQRRA